MLQERKRKRRQVVSTLQSRFVLVAPAAVAGDSPGRLVVDVDGLGGGGGDKLWGGLGPGGLDTGTVMTFIYLEVLSGGQVREV